MAQAFRQPSLEEEFRDNIEAYLRENTLSSVMMVGAEITDDGYLSTTDQSHLRTAVGTLNEFGYPLSPVLAGLDSERHSPLRDPRGVRADLNALSVVNIIPEFGGRDFLEIKEEADIVIFGNIPIHHISCDDNFSNRFSGFKNQLDQSFRERLNNSFAGSCDNTRDWSDAFKRTGAKFAFVVGGVKDCLLAKDVRPEGYVSVNCSGFAGPFGIVMRRDIVQDTELLVHMLEARSPFLRLLSTIANKPKADHFTFTLREGIHRTTNKTHYFYTSYPA